MVTAGVAAKPPQQSIDGATRMSSYADCQHLVRTSHHRRRLHIEIYAAYASSSVDRTVQAVVQLGHVARLWGHGTQFGDMLVGAAT